MAQMAKYAHSSTNYKHRQFGTRKHGTLHNKMASTNVDRVRRKLFQTDNATEGADKHVIPTHRQYAETRGASSMRQIELAFAEMDVAINSIASLETATSKKLSEVSLSVAMSCLRFPSQRSLLHFKQLLSVPQGECVSLDSRGLFSTPTRFRSEAPKARSVRFERARNAHDGLYTNLSASKKQPTASSRTVAEQVLPDTGIRGRGRANQTGFASDSTFAFDSLRYGKPSQSVKFKSSARCCSRSTEWIAQDVLKAEAEERARRKLYERAKLRIIHSSESNNADKLVEKQKRLPLHRNLPATHPRQTTPVRSRSCQRTHDCDRHCETVNQLSDWLVHPEVRRVLLSENSEYNHTGLDHWSACKFT